MIYVDSGVIIRWVEGEPRIREPIKIRFRQLPPQDQIFVTSRIAMLECRCKPLQNRDSHLLRQYSIFFASRELHLLEIDAAVIDKATELRADAKLKTPDAIHAATAILAGVSAFWTTDNDFADCPGLAVSVFRAS